MATVKTIDRVRLPLSSFLRAYDINPRFSSTRRGGPRSDRAFRRAPLALDEAPMYQSTIGDKRASLYPAQRPRNGFCSTSGRRETRVCETNCSAFGPSSGKRSDFNPHAVGLGVHVRL